MWKERGKVKVGGGLRSSNRRWKKSGDQAPFGHLNTNDSWRMLESRHMRGMWALRGEESEIIVGKKTDSSLVVWGGQLVLVFIGVWKCWELLMWLPLCSCVLRIRRSRFLYGSWDCGGCCRAGAAQKSVGIKKHQTNFSTTLNPSQNPKLLMKKTYSHFSRDESHIHTVKLRTWHSGHRKH